MSDYGVIRRPKRTRGTSMTTNDQLDAELQLSIKSQTIGNPPKRHRISSAGVRSCSSSFTPSKTSTSTDSTRREPALSMAADFQPTVHYRTFASNSARQKGQQSSIRTFWGSMSGFFGKEKKQSSVRETVDAFESLQDASQWPSTSNSPRDSGIYIDSRPSSRLKSDDANSRPSNGPKMEYSGVDQCNGPTVALEQPKKLSDKPSESPLKRLQTASMTGLRRVKSLALRQQPSREDMQKEQYEALMKKMTNLQSQLDECKQEFAHLLGNPTQAGNLTPETHSPFVPNSPKSDRGTQTIIDLYTKRDDDEIEGSNVSGGSGHRSIEQPANIGHYDEPPLPKTRDALGTHVFNFSHSLRSIPNLGPLRATSIGADRPDSGHVGNNPAEDMENDIQYLRRSLSTIPSSGDERSPKVMKSQAKNINAGKQSPISAKRKKASRIPVHKSPLKTMEYSVRETTGAETFSNNPLMHVGRSRQYENDRVTVSRSPGEKAQRQYIESSGRDHPERKRKRIVVQGGENTGHFGENGEWVWGPEAF